MHRIWVLRVLADYIVESLLIFSEQWWLERISKRANALPVFKNDKEEELENYRLVSLTSLSEMMYMILKSSISKHTQDKVIGSSLQGIMKANHAWPRH